MALILYMHPLASYCHKVLISLYEKGTPFVPRMIDFADPHAKAAFTALWPTAKIPLLQDEERARVVPETTIIIEYLDQHYPAAQPLLPLDGETRLEARLWDRLFDAYVMEPMQQIVGNQLRPEDQRDARGVADAVAKLNMA